MPRVISFADGFTSSSAPTISSGSEESFTLNNNQAATNIGIDLSGYRAAFVNYSIRRSDTVTTVEQSGDIVFHYDGAAWNIERGNYVGDSVLADSIVNTYDVVLSMSGTNVRYATGNMVGGTHTCTIKMEIVRLST
jgi:hypothetical protein